MADSEMSELKQQLAEPAPAQEEQGAQPCDVQPDAAAPMEGGAEEVGAKQQEEQPAAREEKQQEHQDGHQDMASGDAAPEEPAAASTGQAAPSMNEVFARIMQQKNSGQLGLNGQAAPAGAAVVPLQLGSQPQHVTLQVAPPSGGGASMQPAALSAGSGVQWQLSGMPSTLSNMAAQLMDAHNLGGHMGSTSLSEPLLHWSSFQPDRLMVDAKDLAALQQQGTLDVNGLRALMFDRISAGAGAETAQPLQPVLLQAHPTTAAAAGSHLTAPHASGGGAAPLTLLHQADPHHQQQHQQHQPLERAAGGSGTAATDAHQAALHRQGSTSASVGPAPGAAAQGTSAPAPEALGAVANAMSPPGHLVPSSLQEGASTAAVATTTTAAVPLGQGAWSVLPSVAGGVGSTLTAPVEVQAQLQTLDALDTLLNQEGTRQALLHGSGPPATHQQLSQLTATLQQLRRTPTTSHATPTTDAAATQLALEAFAANNCDAHAALRQLLAMASARLQQRPHGGPATLPTHTQLVVAPHLAAPGAPQQLLPATTTTNGPAASSSVMTALHHAQPGGGLVRSVGPLAGSGGTALALGSLPMLPLHMQHAATTTTTATSNSAANSTVMFPTNQTYSVGPSLLRTTTTNLQHQQQMQQQQGLQGSPTTATTTLLLSNSNGLGSGNNTNNNVNGSGSTHTFTAVGGGGPGAGTTFITLPHHHANGNGAGSNTLHFTASGGASTMAHALNPNPHQQQHVSLSPLSMSSLPQHLQLQPHPQQQHMVLQQGGQGGGAAPKPFGGGAAALAGGQPVTLSLSQPQLQLLGHTHSATHQQLLDLLTGGAAQQQQVQQQQGGGGGTLQFVLQQPQGLLHQASNVQGLLHQGSNVNVLSHGVLGSVDLAALLGGGPGAAFGFSNGAGGAVQLQLQQ